MCRKRLSVCLGLPTLTLPGCRLIKRIIVWAQSIHACVLPRYGHVRDGCLAESGQSVF
jgi:hypothetical protein